ncbi:MAG: alcohol dehydrogenase catalytic domain-containing protein [Oscillospiraceae bacterium]|nr:alcohol dehydrogenase catalytic domain-containing protein [Oscillospiraceae bacterium]
MKTVFCTKTGDLRDPDETKRAKVEVRDVDERQIVHDETVKIKTAYCAICGSDPHTIGGAFSRPLPMGMGHEISGVIAELGKKATKKGFKVGDRVAGNFLRPCGTCNHCRNKQEQFCDFKGEFQCPGMAEYVVWHESQMFKLPDNVSLKEGCLLEPVSVATRIADKTGIEIGARVAISGGGPIGLLTLQMMNMYGATSLTLIEPIAARRELAKQFGAEHTIDPVNGDIVKEAMEATEGMGFDVIVEVSGAPSAALSMPLIAARGGKIVYAAMYPNEYDMPINLWSVFYRKEITMTGVLLSPYTFPRSVQLLPRLQLKPFTQKYFYIDDVTEAFLAHLSGEYSKVLILCNKELENK